MASPFLKAADQSAQAVVEAIELAADEIRIAMFASGCRDLATLAATGLATAE
jgi:isopentenyl diphosphate isomerase/L-lactate dehydrogenase-like FMN-dependent dehydrogenase